MRTLAIDYGSKRIGVALSDEGGTLATPHQVLEINSPRQAIDEILQLILLEDVERIVVGLPLNMDDASVGDAARETIVWARGLATEANLPLVFVDERLSSFAAEQQLADRKRHGEKLTRQRKKEQLDALAAAEFLQAYLDGKLKAIEVD